MGVEAGSTGAMMKWEYGCHGSVWGLWEQSSERQRIAQLQRQILRRSKGGGSGLYRGWRIHLRGRSVVELVDIVERRLE